MLLAGCKKKKEKKGRKKKRKERSSAAARTFTDEFELAILTGSLANASKITLGPVKHGGGGTRRSRYASIVSDFLHVRG